MRAVSIPNGAEIYICVIDQACLVKMTGYWPSSLLRFYRATRKERIFFRGKKAGNDGSILLAAHW